MTAGGLPGPDTREAVSGSRGGSCSPRPHAPAPPLRRLRQDGSWGPWLGGQPRQGGGGLRSESRGRAPWRAAGGPADGGSVGVRCAPGARRRVRVPTEGMGPHLPAPGAVGGGWAREERRAGPAPAPSGAHRRAVTPARSLRMRRGKSTPPTSRHRAPRRPPPRAGPTCTSCPSPRSRCPWPSSRGARVSCSQGRGVLQGGLGAQEPRRWKGW